MRAKVRGLPMAVLLAASISVAGCLGANATAVSQLHYAAGQYRVAQIAIEAAVTSPTIPAKAKAALQQVDREAMAAVKDGEAAIDAGEGSELALYTGIIMGAVQRARALIFETEIVRATHGGDGTPFPVYDGEGGAAPVPYGND